eukprot:TRINITY_DN486_c1_g1_i6.p1 TRINITY_DN486_c1_g1~~TRINITY_DN486_c1_g1_i6.p1  ORF type:complete len:197 (-),score=30.30 TRINITY_DN486_c1_g1_i6:188-778(-)
MKGFVVGGFVGILTMVFACLMGYFGCSFSCYSDFGSLRSVYDKISHPDVTYGKQYPKYFDKTVKLLDSNPASFAIADMFELAETSQEESVSVLIGASNLGTSFALSKYIMEKSVKPLFVFIFLKLLLTAESLWVESLHGETIFEYDCKLDPFIDGNLLFVRSGSDLGPRELQVSLAVVTAEKCRVNDIDCVSLLVS